MPEFEAPKFWSWPIFDGEFGGIEWEFDGPEIASASSNEIDEQPAEKENK